MSEHPSLKLKLSTKKPPLKIKLSKKSIPATSTTQPQGPSNQTPGTTKPKPARKPKPTPKKRALEEDPLTSDDDEEPPASKSAPRPSATKIKLYHAKTKGRLPQRPRGVGYDSEASDRETDPAITESIILRMAPGPDCDYLRSAVAAGNFGPTRDGGADVRFRFLRSDGRRAAVTIRGNHYAAILVDLPCVIEAMKSWFPKTGWIKSADVCQMLMVLGRIEHEEEASGYPLPVGVRGEFDEKTWQWAHGLTPPMHWVRKRRFRQRISVRTVMEVEAEVEHMLQLDEDCEGEPIIEDIYERPNRGSSDEEDRFDGGEDAAAGAFNDELDHAAEETPLDTIEGAEEEDEEAAHARMAEEYEREMMLASSTENLALGPSFDSPAEQTPPSLADDEPSPSSSSSDADEEEEDLDEDQIERQQELQKLKEEVRDVDELIKAEQGKLAATGNQLLRKRIVDKLKGLQQDRELKLAAAGMGGE